MKEGTILIIILYDLITNEMQRQQGAIELRPYRAGPNQAAPPCPCYDCRGVHWIRYFPNPKQERKGEPRIPPLNRSWEKCGRKHLVQDCLVLVDKKGKVTLNYVEMLPSSSNLTSSSNFDQENTLKHHHESPCTHKGTSNKK